MTASEATSLAKEAANVLGGVPPWRGVGTLWADRPIAHRSDERRMAGTIRVGDTLRVAASSLNRGPLTVFAADIRGEGRVIEIIASDHGLAARI